jgi:hypothetical protein
MGKTKRMTRNPVTMWLKERGPIYGIFVDKVKSDPMLRRAKWHCVTLLDSDLKELYALVDQTYGNRVVRFEIINNVTMGFYGTKSVAITYRLEEAR